MIYYSQKDPLYKNKKLGTCRDTIYKSGCKLCCLSSFAEKTPPEVNDILKKRNGYTQGCLISDQIAASILEVEFKGRVTKNPTYPCVMETDHFKNVGVFQHFVVMIDDKHIADPLDYPIRVKKNKYKIVSFRLFSKKNTMKKTYHICSKLEKELRELDQRFDGDSKSSQKKMADGLNEYFEDYGKLNGNYNESLRLINKQRTEIQDYVRSIKNKIEEIEELAKVSERHMEVIEGLEDENKELKALGGGTLINSFRLGKWLIIIKGVDKKKKSIS